MITPAQLIIAVNAAQAGDWHAAHEIAQSHDDRIANWLHAVLHKIEGDVGNSQYWYARTQGVRYDDYSNLAQEFSALLASLD